MPNNKKNNLAHLLASLSYALKLFQMIKTFTHGNG